MTETPKSPQDAAAAPRPPCPTCGKPLPPDAPRGACPACLLGAGVPTGGRVAEVPAAAEVAAAFPDLEIAGLLGRGGMGVVWKARQKGLDRLVALKVLPKDVAQVPGFAERFQREARALARLTHPNIVGVHEFGERGGIFFLVLEYVDGTNVRQAMREGRIAAAAALRIVPQICDALQYAHEHGVVHRDIKPENVLLDREGHVKVTDFGLAKILGADGDRPELTVTGQVMGTLHYMAPEQFEKPTTVDHRADIYSLGVVFYEMLTGELPLGRFPPPSQKFHLDVRLDDVVLRSLEKAPERRWQHAVDVKSEVGTIEATPRAAPAVPGRTSRLAVASFAAAIAAITPAVMAIAAAPGRGVAMAFIASAAGLALFAVAGGIVSWVRIVRSGGALRGLPFAMAATLLPCVVGCVAAPLSVWLVRRAQAVKVEDGIRRAEQVEVDRYRAAELTGVPYVARRHSDTPGVMALDALKALSDRTPAAIVRLYCREDQENAFRFIPGLPGNLEPRSDLGLPWLVRDWPADRLAELSVTTQMSFKDPDHLRVTAVDVFGGNAYAFDVVVENGKPKFRATPVVVTSKSRGAPK